MSRRVQLKARTTIKIVAGLTIDVYSGHIIIKARGFEFPKTSKGPANLSGADLKGVDLRGCDLRGANLDFSCWPLWCGSKDVKVDRRIAAQLAAHFCALDCDDDDYRKARSSILKFAKTSHIAHYMISDADKSPDDKSQGETKEVKDV